MKMWVVPQTLVAHLSPSRLRQWEHLAKTSGSAVGSGSAVVTDSVVVGVCTGMIGTGNIPTGTIGAFSFDES